MENSANVLLDGKFASKTFQTQIMNTVDGGFESYNTFKTPPELQKMMDQILRRQSSKSLDYCMKA